jgi:hypothetical protein
VVHQADGQPPQGVAPVEIGFDQFLQVAVLLVLEAG